MLDVLVIGAGPVGSRTAFQLAGMGRRVAVLEKREGVGQKPCCTGIVSRECITRFSIPQDVVFREALGANLLAPSGELIRVHRPDAMACILNRPAFDRWMAERAESRNVEYHLSTVATNIFIHPDRVVVGAESEGKIYQIEARAVVFATGFNSALVKHSGLGQTGYFTAGAQAEVELKSVENVEVYFDQDLAPGFFAWLVPTAPGKGLVGLLTRQSPGLRLRQWMTKLQAEGRIAAASHQIHYGGIPLKPLTRTFSNRILVVGDAAGQVKPTTGGGIYFGLLCADMAAETLHKSLETGDLSARSLGEYEHRWRKILLPELRREYFARRLYQHLNNRQISNLFKRANSSGIIESLLQEDSLSFDWHGRSMLKVLRRSVAFQACRLIRR